MSWLRFRGRGALAFLTLVAGAAAPLAAAASPAPRPALWLIQDADTTIYLFGTFHTLDARRDWLTPQLRHALDSSGELVLETVVPRQADMARAAGQTRRDGAYFKGTEQVLREGRKKGLTTDHGADAVLRTLAEDGGKAVSGLESFAAQLEALSRIRAAPAPALAVAAPVRVKPVTLDQLLIAWKRGDAGAFAAMLAGFKAKSPAAYETLIAGRNRAWAGWIGKRLERPGTVLLAVGSGHLAGEDSVQSVLAEAGVRAHRIG